MLISEECGRLWKLELESYKKSITDHSSGIQEYSSDESIAYYKGLAQEISEMDNIYFVESIPVVL